MKFVIKKVGLGQLLLKKFYNVDKKHNKIIAIPEIIDILAIEGRIVTIDVMGCQKQIVKKIIEKQADYVLMVKDNQKDLKKKIKKKISNEKRLLATWNDNYREKNLNT